MAPTVLVIDDHDKLRALLKSDLEEAGFRVALAPDGAAARAALQQERADAVVLDLHLPDVDGRELLSELRERYPSTPVVVLTAQEELEAVVECMRRGAVDYLNKPFERTRLLTTLRNACARSELQASVESLTAELRQRQGLGQLLGQSPALDKVKDLLARAAQAEVTVLLEGESGTGKEVAARGLHAEGPRAQRPFVAINCAAIPESLVESTLFGHVKGAFTGASADQPGSFELAQGGVLFLDEVGELRLDVQAKLLRVLQERRVQRLGARREQPIDVQIVAATNRGLQEEASAGRFREDLYYRLAVFPVELPPLRERGEDVLLLAQHFVQSFAQGYGRACAGISARAERALLAHDWPGNVRELENCLRRAVILEDGPELRLGSLPEAVVCAFDEAPAAKATPTQVAEAEADLPGGIEEIRPLDDVVREHIERALELTGGNMSEASRRLGIGRATLYRKVERMGLG